MLSGAVSRLEGADLLVQPEQLHAGRDGAAWGAVGESVEIEGLRGGERADAASETALPAVLPLRGVTSHPTQPLASTRRRTLTTCRSTPTRV